MIPRLKLGRPGRAFRSSFTIGGVHWHPGIRAAEGFCLMGLFQLHPEEVSYLASFGTQSEGVGRGALPVLPVLALRGDSIDNHHRVRPR